MRLKLTITILALSTPLFAKHLNIYSSRTEHLIKPIFDLYTKETGVKVDYLTGKSGGLVQRLLAEGSKTPADILMTVDAGNLWFAEKKGVLSPVSSSLLEQNIPAYLRSPTMTWFGFSMRARTIVYNPKRVSAKELRGYEDLAHPRWQKKLCLRTSQKVYNQSLVAILIATHGKKKTEGIVAGWVKNLAQPVFSNDTSLIKAIARGSCDVGIVNSYYLARLQSRIKDLPVKLFWPDQSTSGVHVNVSGAGITKFSHNKKEALHFLEWLSKPQAQSLFAKLNHEYPVHRSVAFSPAVKSWGRFKANPTNLARAGELQTAAVQLMDRFHYR